MADQKISVLLVDDHSLVRRGFRRMLEDEPDINVVGEASDGEEAVKIARSLKPQVVIMDCALPGINGLQATRKILQFAPETLVLMLSMHTEDTWVRQALDAGARGYVLKNAMDLELGSAIRRIVKGETVGEASTRLGRATVAVRLPFHRCDQRCRNSLQAQQWRLRRQVAARNTRLRLRLPGLRR